MDCNTFLSECLLGIDFEESTRTAPVTHLMSFDRATCSHGNNIHPFRYGQPFLDTIFNALNSDSRGISAAQIRFLPTDTLKEPRAFFHIQWLISHRCINRIVGDEKYPPHVLRQWLDTSGRLLESQALIQLLEKPYSKDSERTGYKDVNLRTERWDSIEEYFAESDWAELVNNTHRAGLSIARDSLEREIRDDLSVDCLSMGVIILAPLA
jgi:ATP-dependent helicase HepA